MRLRTDGRTHARHADRYIPRTYRSGDKKRRDDNLTNMPSEDLDQPGHHQSRPHENTLRSQLVNECTAKTDHTGWMPKMI